MIEAGARPDADRRARPPWALFALVFVVALLVRWSYVGPGPGGTFWPRPDALEYAASAQSIAQDGRYLLQVGPVRVRPRYAPGFPLLLAPALLAGVPGEQLWRVTAAFSALLATCVAAAAWAAARVISRERAAPLWASTISGAIWALSPFGIADGVTVMSDTTATLAALVALASASAVVAVDRSARRAWSIAAGLGFGLAACVRIPSGFLLLPPLAVLAGAAFRRRTLRDLAPAMVWCGGAALVPALACAILLLRSGEPPWHLTDYALWRDPKASYGSASGFSLEHLAWVDPRPRALPPGHVRPTNLALARRLLLGLPGGLEEGLVGYAWPAFSWLALPSLVRRGRRRGGTTATWVGPVALASAGWVAAHVLFWGLYFYPATRYFGPPLVVATLLAGVYLGVRLGESRGAHRWLAVGVALAVLALTLAPHGAARRYLLSRGHVPAGLVRLRFATWRALDDATRAGRPMPFDPLEAQALGLLSPGAAAQIGAWGELPATEQVERLRARGLLPPAAPLPTP